MVVGGVEFRHICLSADAGGGGDGVAAIQPGGARALVAALLQPAGVCGAEGSD